MKIKLIINLIAIALAAFLFTGNAFAENCNNLASNAEWTSGMSQISTYYKAEMYGQVLEVAKVLYNICPLSPTLLYYMGNALEKQGDTSRALIYIQKASENISQMAVEPGTSRQIWYKRYELENPERTAENYKTLKTQATELEKKNIELSTLNSMSSDSASTYKSLMWTGIGGAIAGAAFAATGAGILGSLKENLDIKNKKARITPAYISGWTLLGVGIGSILIGGTVAGVAGYHYSKTNSDAVMSLQLAPNGASFGMTF